MIDKFHSFSSFAPLYLMIIGNNDPQLALSLVFLLLSVSLSISFDFISLIFCCVQRHDRNLIAFFVISAGIVDSNWFKLEKGANPIC